MDNPNKKRSRETDDNDSDHGHANTAFPRFLLIESAVPEEPLTKLSPFVIQKVLVSIAGNPKSVKKLNSGALLVEVERPKHAENLMKITRFHQTPAKCTPHGNLNRSRGIIRFQIWLESQKKKLLMSSQARMCQKLVGFQCGEMVLKKVRTQLSLLFEQLFCQKH